MNPVFKVSLADLLFYAECMQDAAELWQPFPFLLSAGSYAEAQTPGVQLA